MTEQKQIEEMAKIIAEYEDCGNCKVCKYHNCCSSEYHATNLYKAGYRKQVEGEWLFEFTLNGDYFYECSVCSRQAVLNELCDVRNPAISHPYCHCGARMKGGEQG